MLFPLITVDGDAKNDLTLGRPGVTVNGAEAELPLPDAVTVTVVAVLTADVNTVTEPPVAPAGITKLVPPTAGLEVVIDTAKPPAGAAEVSDTEMVSCCPPTTVDGE